MGDEELAIALSDISGAEPATVEDVRREILSILSVAEDDKAGRRPFVFVAMEPVVYRTRYVAPRTLGEFVDALAEVPGESILYHFVTRRALRGGPNDFSRWLAEQFGLHDIARSLSAIDPLGFPDEEALREEILSVLP